MEISSIMGDSSDEEGRRSLVDPNDLLDHTDSVADERFKEWHNQMDAAKDSDFLEADKLRAQGCTEEQVLAKMELRFTEMLNKEKLDFPNRDDPATDQSVASASTGKTAIASQKSPRDPGRDKSGDKSRDTVRDKSGDKSRDKAGDKKTGDSKPGAQSDAQKEIHAKAQHFRQTSHGVAKVKHGSETKLVDQPLVVTGGADLQAEGLNRPQKQVVRCTEAELAHVVKRNHAEYKAMKSQYSIDAVTGQRVHYTSSCKPHIKLMATKPWDPDEPRSDWRPTEIRDELDPKEKQVFDERWEEADTYNLNRGHVDMPVLLERRPDGQVFEGDPTKLPWEEFTDANIENLLHRYVQNDCRCFVEGCEDNHESLHEPIAYAVSDALPRDEEGYLFGVGIRAGLGVRGHETVQVDPDKFLEHWIAYHMRRGCSIAMPCVAYDRECVGPDGRPLVFFGRKAAADHLIECHADKGYKNSSGMKYDNAVRNTAFQVIERHLKKWGTGARSRKSQTYSKKSMKRVIRGNFMAVRSRPWEELVKVARKAADCPGSIRPEHIEAQSFTNRQQVALRTWDQCPNVAPCPLKKEGGKVMYWKWIDSIVNLYLKDTTHSRSRSASTDRKQKEVSKSSTPDYQGMPPPADSPIAGRLSRKDKGGKKAPTEKVTPGNKRPRSNQSRTREDSRGQQSQPDFKKQKRVIRVTWHHIPAVKKWVLPRTNLEKKNKCEEMIKLIKQSRYTQKKAGNIYKTWRAQELAVVVHHVYTCLPAKLKDKLHELTEDPRRTGIGALKRRQGEYYVAWRLQDALRHHWNAKLQRKPLHQWKYVHDVKAVGDKISVHRQIRHLGEEYKEKVARNLSEAVRMIAYPKYAEACLEAEEEGGRATIPPFSQFGEDILEDLWTERSRSVGQSGEGDEEEEYLEDDDEVESEGDEPEVDTGSIPDLEETVSEETFEMEGKRDLGTSTQTSSQMIGPVPVIELKTVEDQYKVEAYLKRLKAYLAQGPQLPPKKPETSQEGQKVNQPGTAGQPLLRLSSLDQPKLPSDGGSRTEEAMEVTGVTPLSPPAPSRQVMPTHAHGYLRSATESLHKIANDVGQWVTDNTKPGDSGMSIMTSCVNKLSHEVDKFREVTEQAEQERDLALAQVRDLKKALEAETTATLGLRKALETESLATLNQSRVLSSQKKKIKDLEEKLASKATSGTQSSQQGRMTVLSRPTMAGVVKNESSDSSQSDIEQQLQAVLKEKSDIEQKMLLAIQDKNVWCDRALKLRADYNVSQKKAKTLEESVRRDSHNNIIVESSVYPGQLEMASHPVLKPTVFAQNGDHELEQQRRREVQTTFAAQIAVMQEELQSIPSQTASESTATARRWLDGVHRLVLYVLEQGHATIDRVDGTSKPVVWPEFHKRPMMSLPMLRTRGRGSVLQELISPKPTVTAEVTGDGDIKELVVVPDERGDVVTPLNGILQALGQQLQSIERTLCTPQRVAEVTTQALVDQLPQMVQTVGKACEASCRDVLSDPNNNLMGVRPVRDVSDSSVQAVEPPSAPVAAGSQAIDKEGQVAMHGSTEDGEQAPHAGEGTVTRDDPDETLAKTLEEPMDASVSRETGGSIPLSDPRVLQEAADKANQEYLNQSEQAGERQAMQQLLTTPEPKEEEPEIEVMAEAMESLGHAPATNGTPLGNRPSTSSTKNVFARRERIADKVVRTTQHLRDAIDESDKAQRELQAVPPDAPERKAAEAKATASLEFKIKIEKELVDTHTEETKEYLYSGYFDDVATPVTFDDLSQLSLSKMSIPQECYAPRLNEGDGMPTIEITPDSVLPGSDYGVNLPVEPVGEFSNVPQQELPTTVSPRRESDPLLSAGGIQESSDEDTTLKEQSFSGVEATQGEGQSPGEKEDDEDL